MTQVRQHFLPHLELASKTQYYNSELISPKLQNVSLKIEGFITQKIKTLPHYLSFSLPQK